MLKTLSLLTLIASSLTIAAPANATNGRDALASCTANPKCRARVDADGGVVITVGGHTIYCPPANGECEVVYRRGNKWLQVGDLPTLQATGNGKTALEAAATVDALLK